MRRLHTAFLFALTIPLYFACDDDHMVDRGCGCDTDSLVFTFRNREAEFFWGTYEPTGAWTISVKDPGPQFMIGRICNTGHPTIKAIVDTLSHTSTVPVKFWGKIRQKCPEEFHPISLANVSHFHLTVDSLHVN